ncbi:MAG: HTTM domain-containing protein [Planctomycetaceae bacterium]|nr:HTTM domain-containing protein [Planctomycetaceae bacterium]
MNQVDEQSAPVENSSASWWNRLWQPCDIASVAFFRVCFAGTVLVHVAMVLNNDWVTYYFGTSPYHMKFYGFEWVEALDVDGMGHVHRLMGLAAIGVGIGLFYRLSAVLLFVTFTYTLLAEAALFQNHYYLTSLISFVLILIPAHRSFSVDAWLFSRKASSFIPNWCRWLLMFLVGVPYFYGGIAKINMDWLNAMPLLIWIPQKTHVAVIGSVVGEPWFAWFLSYSGLLLDLLIVPLLLWRRTRLFAYIAIVFFHLLNSQLFKIDVFPWMMILLTTIFFDADWPRRLLRWPSPSLSADLVAASQRPTTGKRIVLSIVCVFVVWQAVFPLRHYVYPGDASWTEEGQNFSWRMMLHHKDLFVRFYAIDGVTGQTVAIPASRMLTQRQMLETSKSPEQMAAVARFFAESAERLGMKNVQIRAVAIAALNGRKPQLLFDPTLDLLTVDRSWRHQSWIRDLEEPLRDEPWTVPSSEWPQLLGVELPQVTAQRRRPAPGPRQPPVPQQRHPQ